jgi:hypothetical protein
MGPECFSRRDGFLKRDPCPRADYADAIKVALLGPGKVLGVGARGRCSG